MSLTRQFLREFRPLFRMLEEPFGRSFPQSGAYARRSGLPLSVFNEPFFNNGGLANVPAIDVSEEPGAYVVEAELPGVKKENVELRIGDNGESLTIEGRTFVRSGVSDVSGASAPEVEQTPEGQAAQISASTEAPSMNGGSQAVTQASSSTQLSTERAFSASSSFSRTIWLPRRVDGSGVSAKLSDGILTVRIPKAEDQGSVKINVE